MKHPREKFPTTNGWEFFDLEVSQEGTKIKDEESRSSIIPRACVFKLSSTGGEVRLRL